MPRLISDTKLKKQLLLFLLTSMMLKDKRLKMLDKSLA